VSTVAKEDESSIGCIWAAGFHHVSGMFIAHHQEVFTIYVQQLVRVIGLVDWQLAGSVPS
jgi:hypothetical protein